MTSSTRIIQLSLYYYTAFIVLLYSVQYTQSEQYNNTPYIMQYCANNTEYREEHPLQTFLTFHTHNTHNTRHATHREQTQPAVQTMQHNPPYNAAFM